MGSATGALSDRVRLVGLTGAVVVALLLLPFGIKARATPADENGTAPLVHLATQPGECGNHPGTDSGVVNVHLNAVQDRFMVNVSVHDAMPDTLYQVDIRCDHRIGAFITNAQGTGTAHIELPSALGPATEPFFIDIGPPSGCCDTFVAGPFNLT